MSAEENKAVIRRLLEEGWNQHNLDVIDDLNAMDYVDHSAPPGFPPDKADA
jgi:hypothetical protein